MPIYVYLWDYRWPIFGAAIATALATLILRAVYGRSKLAVKVAAPERVELERATSRIWYGLYVSTFVTCVLFVAGFIYGEAMREIGWYQPGMSRADIRAIVAHEADIVAEEKGLQPISTMPLAQRVIDSKVDEILAMQGK